MQNLQNFSYTVRKGLNLFDGADALALQVNNAVFYPVPE